MPLWVYALYIVAIVIVLSLLPKAGMDFVLRSDASKIIGLTAATVGFGAVLLSYIQLSLELRDRAEDREALQEERTDRYIARLLERAPGNTGKGRAFGALLHTGEFIEGFDLSCEALGVYNQETLECEAPPEFADIDFDDDDGATISRAYFTDSEITYSTLNYLEFLASGFAGTKFRRVYIFASVLEGNFTDAIFYRSEVVSSKFEIDEKMGWPAFQLTNISGSTVPWLDRLNAMELKELYFWADSPPLKSDNMPNFVPSNVDLMRLPLQPSPFFGTLLLSQMNICSPPKSPGGLNLPPEGETVPLERREMLKSIDGQTRALCMPMTIEEAMRRYPEAYTITQPRILLPFVQAPSSVKRRFYPIREPW